MAFLGLTDGLYSTTTTTLLFHEGQLLRIVHVKFKQCFSMHHGIGPHTLKSS